MKAKTIINEHNEKIKDFRKIVDKSADNIFNDNTKKANIHDIINSSNKQELLNALARKKAKENYAHYMKYVFPEYVFTPFHKYLCNLCDSIVKRIEKANSPNATEQDKKNGKVRILISVPPRHGKSQTITETLPSYFIGRNPNCGCIITGYNSEIAEKFEDSNRQKTKQFGKELFGIEVDPSNDNKTIYKVKGKKGGLLGTGIQGGITGFGANLIIVDDPYKNGEEANSKATRDRIENNFRDSVMTRLEGSGNALIVIQTRWHEDDICGHYAKKQGWYVVNIPCICDGNDPYLHRQLGETLCPELGYDVSWANEIKENVGLKVWEALYQGHPTIDGGEIFTRDMIKHYTKQTLPLAFEELTLSCDLSFGGTKQSNDPCAMQVWGRVGANHYLLHRYKKRLTFNETCEKIKGIRASFPQIKRTIVEKKANGQAVIDTLNGQLGGFIAYDPKMESKIGRANSITYLFEAGNVFLPCKEIDKTIEEMEQELMAFPNGTHDDEVDAMSQYLISSENRAGGKVLTDSYFSQLSKAFRGLKI